MLFRGKQTDAEVVRRVLSGEREAYAVLVERYVPMVHALAYGHVSNREDVKDLVQETFLKAFEKLWSLEDAARFRAWLASIVRNQCLNFRVAEHRKARALAEVAREPAISPDVARRELHELLRQQLFDLDAECREILLLHYFAGFKVREIAATLGISRAAAAKRLQRAREVLGRNVVSQLGAALAPHKHRETWHAEIMALLPVMPGKWNAGVAVSKTAGLVYAIKAAREVVLVKKVCVALTLAVCVIVAWKLSEGRRSGLPPENKFREVRVQQPRSDDLDESAFKGKQTPVNATAAPPVESAAAEEPAHSADAGTPELEAAGTGTQPEGNGPSGSPSHESGEQSADRKRPTLPAEGVVVTVSKDGETPVADAGVFLDEPPRDGEQREADARTDAEGRFTVQVSIESHQVYALHPDYAPGWASMSPEWGEESRSAHVPSVRIVLAQGGAVEGRVTLGGQPQPDADVVVESYNAIKSARTGPDGSYQLAQVTPGQLLVHAALRATNRTLGRSVVVEPGQVTVVDFPFEGGNSVVRGLVSVDGRPAKGGSVRLVVTTRDDEEVLTVFISETGEYVVTNVPAGEAAMAVSVRLDDGAEIAKQIQFSVAENETTLQDLALSRDTILLGNVAVPEDAKDGVILVLKGDVQIPDLSVETLTSLERLIAASDSPLKGNYRVEGLDPGTYTVVALIYRELPGSEADALAEMLANALFASAVVEVESGKETVADLSPAR